MIDDVGCDERCDYFRSLVQGIVILQRRRLLQYRDHTWQSAYVDDDGYLAEFIPSIVTGAPSTESRGVSRAHGDLADRTKAKKGYRVDPNIDFMLCGGVLRRQGDARFVALYDIPDGLKGAG